MRLKCSFGTELWGLTVNRTKCSSGTSLWNSILIVTIFTGLAHCTFRNLFCCSIICKSTNRTHNRLLSTFSAPVTYWTRICFIFTTWSMRVSLSNTNISWCTWVYNSTGLTELCRRARSTIGIILYAGTISLKIKSSSTCRTIRINICFIRHTHFIHRTCCLNTCFTGKSWWTSITRWHANLSLNLTIWTN
jgi:hypothetical protein